MATEIRVPALGESVTEAIVGKWFKKPGDAVKVDEPLVELETDKVTVEVPAPTAGVLGDHAAKEGETVAVGALLGLIGEGAGASAAETKSEPKKEKKDKPAPAAAESNGGAEPSRLAEGAAPPSPAARKHLAEAGIDAADVAGSGKRGQVLKEDAVKAASAAAAAPSTSSQGDIKASAAPAFQSSPGLAPSRAFAPMPVPAQNLRIPSTANDAAREERVRMTRLRQTIAQRLKDAQNTAAMLTTFNDVDMGAVMELRARYKDLFEKRHGVKLGFMGFFVKACLQALKEIPAVNAEIDGDEIIYKNYYHIGVAVGTDRGLVVPVVREADRMSLAEIEAQISDFGKRARDGKLSIDEMQGGTFTITNGGVYGSMMSTPILNAPQSGILGMHRIEERAVVRDGQIVARPMMYLALSYDHRIVDGKEAVAFLVRVKECLEDPQRFLLEL
ncbi:Dihydrolipoamide succinyltransferase component (E2) of 2-oxoglutarate dehydrogenase complex [Hyphomicrobium sulfonivorans]|uniref:Dihydrolipoyllysine-residue succinyltransferase component of 2-oxoglutarate dehydrogenase complex n=1 Tax=Hyphomicrobium sulfonivorans TaxID=121290 RepID=A0A109BM70_HYPSL|nr:2-oxoglutarate dehydrogenase complex dihydrolipoyllysine-residue succinyltransferase [Hyphomicrobium sulfonivorans]KWT71060.1 Dihydrolipoamide succinyltransferase component (E2) of 2-oxoglutarate dehydrogenase complex [Hyphomicrobium sulfonivorans]